MGILLTTAVAAALIAPFDLFAPHASPELDLGISALGLSMLALVRVRGGLSLAVAGITLMLVFIGAGQLLLREEPGNPTVAWILILGMLPALHARLPVAAIAAAGTWLAAALLAAPAPAAPSLTPAGDVIGVCLASWSVVVVILAVHSMALAELRAELSACESEEARLVAATDQLGAEARQSESLLTALVHDLRTPLNGVIGLAELLGSEPAAAAVAAELDALRATGRGMARALDTLLCLARTHTNGPETARLVDLNGLLDAAATKGTLLAPGAIVAAHCGTGCPRLVTASPGPLRAIVDQLVAAAVEGGVARLFITSECETGGVTVALSGELHDHPTGDHERSRRLGMALAAALADALGARCEAADEGVRGWRATVHLPLLETPAQA